MHLHRLPILLALLLPISALAQADPGKMTVDVGWGNAYRAGRWNPVYITAKSSPPRDVIAEVEGMVDAPHAMTLGNRFALSPDYSTHVIYFPLGEEYELSETVLTLRDAETLKRIASTKLKMTPPSEQAPLGQPMIGVSGDISTSILLKDQFAGDGTVGYLTPEYLPAVAVGYDALDVLVLNSPDFSKIRDDQQRAIVEWLRGGGTLILWPGANATPEGGPLIDILPAAMGENALIDVDPAAVERAGITRVQKVRGRKLTPAPDAEAIAVLGPQFTAYRRSIGFGQIVMAPGDLATFRFQSEDAVRAFWKPLLHGVPDRMRDNIAHLKVARWVRDAHATGGRGAPIWLIVGLVIVGPLDSFLLVLLGRRPWSIVTVLGWAGLIGAIVYNVREQKRPETVAYRSLRIIDEVDRAAAGVTDFVSVRWPVGAAMEFPEERGAWWRAAIDPTDPPTSPRSEFHVAQHDGGTWPTRMPAHVGTPIMLEAQRWTSAPSIIDATLSVKDGRVTGKLTNRGDRPLGNVRVRTSGGVTRLERQTISPGATVDVDAKLDPADPSLAMPGAEMYWDVRRAKDTPILLPDYAVVEASTFTRSMRMADLVAKGDRACVYAELVDPAAPVDLPVATDQKHMMFVRSMTRLE